MIGSIAVSSSSSGARRQAASPLRLQIVELLAEARQVYKRMWICTYRLASLDSYRISFDGVEVGSVSKRFQHTTGNEYWRWAVDIMPLMDHGGGVPSGEAETFDTTLAAFKAAFMHWHANLAPGRWQQNRDYIKAADRW